MHQKHPCTTSVDDVARVARLVHLSTTQLWGNERAVSLVGSHPRWVETLERLHRVAAADAPTLINGETGTGKELLARAVFALARAHRRTLLTVNCAQFANHDMLASELFGHRRGSFTGAVADKVGILEAADGGCVFLDEVGELPLGAQAILLRAIGEGEILPVGATTARKVDIRIIAATNRDLPDMVRRGTFRADLYYRLGRLKVTVPPLRARGDDWQHIAAHHLDVLASRTRVRKALGRDARQWMERYAWPGNVRELIGCIETGYHLSENGEIALRDIGDTLEDASRQAELGRVPLATESGAESRLERMVGGEGDFWALVAKPFLARDLSRGEVQDVIAVALERTQGSYKRALALLGLAEGEYLRFMDFLRHHRLKARDRGDRMDTSGEWAVPIDVVRELERNH